MKKFNQFFTKDDNLNRIQKNIEEAFQPLLSNEVIDGNLLENVSLVSGSVNVIKHGLDRKYRGWIVVDKNANANIYSSTSNVPEKTLLLNTTLNCVVSIWIF